MFRGLPILKDPRAALFGLTLFSHANPGLEKQLEMFAGILEATRNSLSSIRGEMHSFETNMQSLALPPQNSYTTQPVSAYEDQEVNMSYSNPSYSSTSEPESTMADNQIREDQVKSSLERFMTQNPDRMDDFLDELEQLIRKYR